MANMVLEEKGKTGYDSFKWKMNPLSVDAVIIYAQKGHGIRSGIFSITHLPYLMMKRRRRISTFC